MRGAQHGLAVVLVCQPKELRYDKRVHRSTQRCFLLDSHRTKRTHAVRRFHPSHYPLSGSSMGRNAHASLEELPRRNADLATTQAAMVPKAAPVTASYYYHAARRLSRRNLTCRSRSSTALTTTQPPLASASRFLTAAGPPSLRSKSETEVT